MISGIRGEVRLLGWMRAVAGIGRRGLVGVAGAFFGAVRDRDEKTCHSGSALCLRSHKNDSSSGRSSRAHSVLAAVGLFFARGIAGELDWGDPRRRRGRFDSSTKSGKLIHRWEMALGTTC